MVNGMGGWLTRIDFQSSTLGPKSGRWGGSGQRAWEGGWPGRVAGVDQDPTKTLNSKNGQKRWTVNAMGGMVCQDGRMTLDGQWCGRGANHDGRETSVD